MLSASGRVYPYPEIAIASVDLELLEWVKEKYGGVISSKRKYEDHHQQSYTWRVTNQRALSILSLVLPHLKIKRKQDRARLLLVDYTLCTARNGKYTKEMKEQKEKLVEEFKSL